MVEIRFEFFSSTFQPASWGNETRKRRNDDHVFVQHRVEATNGK